MRKHLINLLLISQYVLAHPHSPSETFLVRWEPETLVNGSPCLFQIRSARSLTSLSGAWQGRKVFFDFEESSRTWYGLAGVGIDTASGQYILALEATLTNGARIISSHPVTVGRGNYPTIDILVPQQFTEPDAETLARIKKERAIKNKAFSRITNERLWIGGFAAPIDSVITDFYGVKRIFNGARQSIHQGLDFRADTGTPIGAMNNGTVLIAQRMFYEGGFIVLNHGRGLMTLYMHLSEIKVNEGDRVKTGQIIGSSGATGRVTGPHLHVGVRWQGFYLNPETLWQFNIQ